jgi:arginine/serine-rich splicing factor 4/5/6
LTGFAFVEYDDPRDAKDAIRDLDGSKFMGERLIFTLYIYSIKDWL